MLTTETRVGEKRYNGIAEHARMLREAGEWNGLQLTKLLLDVGVLDLSGYVYKPTKNAVLELLKWHAGGGAVVAIPMARLALELGCGVYIVRCLIEELERDGLVQRHKCRAPGTLYTTEILGPRPEPEPGPLAPIQEHLLRVLRGKMDTDGLVQTSEHELALALDVSHETVSLALATLRHRGYVSATVAEYGRPYIVKVLHAQPVVAAGVDLTEEEKAEKERAVDAYLSERGLLDLGSDGRGPVRGYCLKCRVVRELRDPRIQHLDGVRGKRTYLEGVCSVCGTKACVFVKSFGEQQESGNGEDRLIRFLKWQRELRQQEQEKLDELIKSYTV